LSRWLTRIDCWRRLLELTDSNHFQGDYRSIFLEIQFDVESVMGRTSHGFAADDRAYIHAPSRYLDVEYPDIKCDRTGSPD
jgi:hypothetical protein